MAFCDLINHSFGILESVWMYAVFAAKGCLALIALQTGYMNYDN